MSEHTHIIGKVDYIHLPYRENGFTFCKNCRMFIEKAEVEFHEGFGSDWMKLVCSKCKKTIWVCSFMGDWELEQQNKGKKEKDKNYTGYRRFITDDKKCFVCNKPTNYYDCNCCGGHLGEMNYWCSSKCRKIQDKIDRKVYHFDQELRLCFEAQDLEYDREFISNKSREIYKQIK